MSAPVPAWKLRLWDAADEDFERDPGSAPTPEISARLRRVLPPPPGDGVQAA